MGLGKKRLSEALLYGVYSSTHTQKKLKEHFLDLNFNALSKLCFSSVHDSVCEDSNLIFV